MDIVRLGRILVVAALLGTAVALSAASGVLSGGGLNATNADLNGCYSYSNGGAWLDSYWFDGGTGVTHIFWSDMTGSSYTPGTYEVSPGELYIEYEDGSTEQFQMSVQSDGVELDGNWFEYTGASCD